MSEKIPLELVEYLHRTCVFRSAKTQDVQNLVSGVDKGPQFLRHYIRDINEYLNILYLYHHRVGTPMRVTLDTYLNPGLGWESEEGNATIKFEVDQRALDALLNGFSGKLGRLTRLSKPKPFPAIESTVDIVEVDHRPVEDTN
uniref:Uncharacterized protein n=1 Tax=Timema cristinae TaxID=61476 RepID=A0A7R9CAV4_TIMCR|nr:unnamed protein product [Timema cristinae]